MNRRYAFCMTQLVAGVDGVQQLVAAVDSLVEDGAGATRSEAVRLGLTA